MDAISAQGRAIIFSACTEVVDVLRVMSHDLDDVSAVLADGAIEMIRGACEFQFLILLLITYNRNR